MEKIDFTKARNTLGYIWLSAALFLLLLFVVLVFSGALETSNADVTNDVGLWLMPYFAPIATMSVIARFSGQPTIDSQIEKSQFTLAMLISIGYIFILIVSFLICLAMKSAERPLVDLLQTSNLWLSFIHGLVLIPVTMFFNKKVKE